MHVQLLQEALKERTKPAKGKRGRSESPEGDRDRGKRPRSDRRDGSFKDGKSSFRDGADRNGSTVCTVCLTKERDHQRRDCAADNFWNGKPTFVKRDGSKPILIARSGGAKICPFHNLPRGCYKNHQDDSVEHRCSGCGSTTHSAQKCSHREK
jgi:hypothetical protein